MVTRLVILLAALGLVGCSSSHRRGGVEKGEGPAGGLEYLDPSSDQEAEAHARYANAVLLDLNDRPHEAATEFLQAAMADPRNEELVMDVSRRLLHEKMYDEMARLLQRAVAQPNASGALYARLGVAYALQGHRELALQANRTAIKKDPAHIAGYRHLAQIYLQEGKGAMALDVLDEAAAQTSVDLPFLLELAELYLSIGQSGGIAPEKWKPKTVTVLDRARDLGPQTALHLQKLAEDYHAAGEELKARDIYVRLMEQLPDVPGIREKLIEMYLRQHETERAVPLLEKLVKESPTNPQAHYFLGLIAMEKNQFAEAVEHLSKTVLLNPEMEQPYYDLAAAQLGLGAPKKALDILADARQHFPQKFLLEYYSGIAYNQLNDHATALNHLTAAEVIARATEPDRLTHTFYFQLGAVSERNKQYTEAEGYFKKCLEQAPDFSQAMNYLGYMWAERGEHLDQARELIEKAVALEPDNAAYLDSLAWVLFKLGKPEQALQQMEAALAKSSEPDPTLYDHLGDIQFQLKRVDQARQAWKKALEMEPNKTIQEKLDAAEATPKT